VAFDGADRAGNGAEKRGEIRQYRGFRLWQQFAEGKPTFFPEASYEQRQKPAGQGRRISQRREGLATMCARSHSPVKTMKSISSGAIRITKPVAKSAASRARAQFNKLVKQLEQERALLADWREAIPRLRQLSAQELEPLEQAYDQQRRRLVVLFDHAYDDKLMGKRDKAKLFDLICTLVEDLLIDGEDAELEAIYNKYVGDDFTGLTREEDEAMARGMLEEMLGAPLGDDFDTSSPEAMLASLQAKMAEQAAAQEAQQVERAKQGAPRKRAKSAKAAAQEERQQAEQQRLQQSVRDIYRKLASALHPDRETDVAERDRKTALMQRVNVAYAANDLLGLLELQLEVEQLDQNGLDNLLEERIKQYNKILDGQVKQLQHENDELAFMLSMELGIEPYMRPAPAMMEQWLRDEVADRQSRNEEIARDIVDFHDFKKLKAWLKTYRIPKDRPMFEDDWF
jgi:hypothetical protein